MGDAIHCYNEYVVPEATTWVRPRRFYHPAALDSIYLFAIDVAPTSPENPYNPFCLDSIADMAEGTIALSIPGLFLTCVQYFTLVRLGREFTNDFGSCLLQLRATEISLHRWGRAAGITDERSETFVKQLQHTYTPQEITFAHNACKQIAKQLRRAKEDSEDMLDANHGPEELDVADELRRMEICEPKASRASRALQSVKAGYEQSLRFTSKATVRGKWALYKKKELTDLLTVIGEHVATLEKLFPQQERDLAAAEATKMERDAIKILASITTARDPFLAEALRAEAPRKGYSWDNIKTSGYATAHYGTNRRTEDPNAAGSSWSNMTTDGYAVVHAGDNIGYETPLPAIRHVLIPIQRTHTLLWHHPIFRDELLWFNCEEKIPVDHTEMVCNVLRAIAEDERPMRRGRAMYYEVRYVLACFYGSYRSGASSNG